MALTDLHSLAAGDHRLRAVPHRPRTVVFMAGDCDSRSFSAWLGDTPQNRSAFASDVVVDMSEVSFIDAGAIGAMVKVRALLQAHECSFEIRAASRCVRRLLALCELGSMNEPTRL